MKTRKMIVPRYVIERHYPHPELYGESIVLLENGLSTDVYTDLEGRLFTETNNVDLILYLKSLNPKEEKMEWIDNNIIIKEVDFDDAEMLHNWFYQSPYRRYDMIANAKELVRLYISHAKTANSSVFSIEINQKKIGIIGYTIIDQIAILHTEIYHHRSIDPKDMICTVSRIKTHLVTMKKLKKMIFLVSEFDDYIKDSLISLGFIQDETPPILIPTFTNYTLEYAFVYLISHQ